MTPSFSMKDPATLDDNVFRLIGTDWMLVTAGTTGSFNTMTASWGGLGVLWNRNVCFCFIRPQRYTWEFMEKSDRFTLSFFDASFRKALQYCGAYSGRHVDKAAETGLTSQATASGAVFFREARLVLECRKIYFQDIIPANFVDPALAENYPNRDYHRMYVGEISGCMVR